MNVEITFDRKWFEKHKQEFLDAWNTNKFIETADKDKNYTIHFTMENGEHLVTDDGAIKIQGYDDSENDASISVLERPSTIALINLASIITKYYNKAKTAFEALK